MSDDIPARTHFQRAEEMALFGGVEAGGTKFVCAVGDGLGTIRNFVRFPTTTPEETLGRVVQFFQRQEPPIQALGVGCFGPIDLHAGSPHFGHITSTPKPGWSFTDVHGYLTEALGMPVVFETDVNVAAVGECRYGAAEDVDSFVYVTVGTGIGGGALIKGQPLHGLVHPEMGHVFVRRAPGDSFAGVCPYHGDCLEGLASGPAIEARWGVAAETLPPDHEAWRMQAHYLAEACALYTLILSPRLIVLGGGVMKQEHLFPMIREKLQQTLGGYVRHPLLETDLERYIVPAGVGGRNAVLGAISLARQHFRQAEVK